MNDNSSYELDTLSQKTILVVEGNIALRQALCEFFEESGFRVFATANQEQGLIRLEHDAVHLIVIDLDNMPPEEEALPLCLHAEERGAKVIMLASESHHTPPQPLISQPLLPLLNKPFHVSHLIYLCQSLLTSSR